VRAVANNIVEKNYDYYKQQLFMVTFWSQLSISRPVFQLRDWEILSPGNSGLKKWLGFGIQGLHLCALYMPIFLLVLFSTCATLLLFVLPVKCL